MKKKICPHTSKRFYTRECVCVCVYSERKKNAEQKKIRINPRHQRKEKKTPSLDMTWAIYFPKHSCIHREKKIRLSKLR